MEKEEMEESWRKTEDVKRNNESGEKKTRESWGKKK